MQPLSFCTGTRDALGSISGLAEAQPLTHIEALELDEVHEHLLLKNIAPAERQLVTMGWDLCLFVASASSTLLSMKLRCPC
jgi:hypothetical protein